MKRPSSDFDPTFLPGSLAVSNVGTWDYNVASDRLRYCRAMAALYGLPREEGGTGVPMERVLSITHPDDRGLSHTKRAHLFRHGGAFLFEHRIVPSPQVTRWVLVRGFYELDLSGQGVRGRGIVVDVTEGRQEGWAESVLFMTEADDRSVSALDRATRHVLAARSAIGELDPGSADPLRPAADALLLEIAHQIAGTLVPVMPHRTKH